MDYRQMYTKYIRGEYKFPPPPIPHTYWNAHKWIDYIDAYGEWF